MGYPRIFFAGLALLACCVFSEVQAATPKLSFNRDVRPILAENCLNCHGQDEKSRKGGLRLDDREAALKGGKSGEPAIVAGNPLKSELLKRITTQDEDDVMPPLKEGKKISTEQVAKLKQWISEGAEYEGHWAFQAPQRLQVDLVSRRSSLDSLVLAKLKQEKLKPAREASPETLIRRLSLDLVGLPPTLDEVEAFKKDYQKRRETAYRELMERLLASKHFGEKWARHWMDVARYADSDGYEKDLPRNQWPWRDWVINAFNADMPYNQFIVEQIAGDQLPNPSQDQIIATGFLRNGMVNEEGAIIFEQFRKEGVFDRMDCVGKAVLGMTLQCAQCHTHKFDPITHEEYYKLFAYFNNDYEAMSWIHTPDQKKMISAIAEETRKLESQFKKENPSWSEELAKWEKTVSESQPSWQNLSAYEHEWGGGLAHPERMTDDSIITLGFRPTVGELWIIATNVPGPNLTGLRLEALTHGDLPFNGPGRSYKGSFAISELKVEVREIGATNGWKQLHLTNAAADYSQERSPIEEYFKNGKDDARRLGPARYLIDGKNETAWSGDLGNGKRNRDMTWVAEFVPTNSYPAGKLEMRVELKYAHGGDDGHGRDNNFLGRFRVALTTNTNPAMHPISRPLRDLLGIPKQERTSKQNEALFTEWRESMRRFGTNESAVPLVNAMVALNQKLDAVWKDYPMGETILHLNARDGEYARKTEILDRGAWDKPKEVVTPGVPKFLHDLPPNADDSRLTVARWLADEQSPTTARVMVNRVWQALFGMGLVETPEDFGIRASLPAQPDLLDWLSVEFMRPAELTDSGSAKPWSLKHLLRVIVTSSTYRQDSSVTPKVLELDPQNKLLARGPRFRAESEVVRDIVLASAGLLNSKIGGPSFYPPVPESMFALNFTKIDWKPASAPERYRRSLYMFRRRSMPDPVMGSFDSPNGDFACARRVRSNTPLAALTSLNEPVFLEAAQALAMKILREGGKTDAERTAFAFKQCTGRAPTSNEIELIAELLKSRYNRIAEGWIAPKDVAFGEPAKMPELPEGVNPAQAGAWTIVARVLLNLDETITKN